MLKLIYQRLNKGCIRPGWMAVAYFDWMRCQEVCVLFPFHYLVMFGWWLNFKWCKYRSKPSWIDRQVVAAICNRWRSHSSFTAMCGKGDKNND